MISSAGVVIDFDRCQYREVSNQLAIPPVHATALSEVDSVPLAQMFKALGDPVRLRLLSLIASHPGGEACVCDVSGTFDLSQPTISHHLKSLRSAGLIDSERRGSWVYYRIIPSALQQLSAILHIDVGTAGPSRTCTEETAR